MRRLLILCASLTVLSVLAFAENWTGTLVDANCAMSQQQQQQQQEGRMTAGCEPSSTTTAFALRVGTKTYKLDDEGNAKTVTALKDRADRMKDDSSTTTAPIRARVGGTLENDIIKVDSIQVQ